MAEVNSEFGLPPLEPEEQETTQQRIARLRARAEAQAATEFDEDAVYAQLLAEARASKVAEISKDAIEFPTDTQGLPEDYDRIEIFRGQNKNDLEYAPLGLDGFVIKIPRGEEVIIPHAFVTECLDQAIEEVTVQSQGGLITRPAHRFPYNFKGKATPAEYKAYQAGQRAKAQRETKQAA